MKLKRALLTVVAMAVMGASLFFATAKPALAVACNAGQLCNNSIQCADGYHFCFCSTGKCILVL